MDPWKQIQDHRAASYSGGHVLVVAAVDPRVRCVVSQVPLAAERDWFQQHLG